MARGDLVADPRGIRARAAQRLASILDERQLETLRQIQDEEGQSFDDFLSE